MPSFEGLSQMELLFSNDTQGRHAPSYYAATANALPRFLTLKQSLRTDVCIIGGGFTGLSSALHLAQRGFDVVLLEAHRVGWGASGRNGGQVGSGQRLGQDVLEQQLGHDAAHALWDIAQQAKHCVSSLIETHQIKCDHRPGVIHADWRASQVSHNHAYAEKLERDYGYGALELLDRQAICGLLGTKVYHGGYLDRGASHLHPLNLALGIADAANKAGAKIFETTLVSRIEKGSKTVVVTRDGTVTADQVILACNGYLGRLEKKTAARIMPINNFIVATKPLGKDLAQDLIRGNLAVADSKFVVNYYRRTPDNRLLFGGGETYGYKFPKDIRALVRKPMLQIFPQTKGLPLDYAWGGTLAITPNRLPYFARIAPNILSASGYSGHGVALAVMAGKIMAEAIRGQAERFDVMAKLPTRKFPGGDAFRFPALVLAMTWYSLRDRLGV